MSRHSVLSHMRTPYIMNDVYMQLYHYVTDRRNDDQWDTKRHHELHRYDHSECSLTFAIIVNHLFHGSVPVTWATFVMAGAFQLVLSAFRSAAGGGDGLGAERQLIAFVALQLRNTKSANYQSSFTRNLFDLRYHRDSYNHYGSPAPTSSSR